ncbi:aminoacyl-tRNA hydrolase [Elongatibacter sediminis]|uniref:aminoacyl-tRNA hydrolase n=1 Tax=Elongatibacter sediminis TaxID=3119006 RepID=UPI003F4BE34F
MIVGLGNPGPKYAETRHNAGFWFLDRVLQRFGGDLRAQSKLKAETARTVIEGRDCVLARPASFMNESGLPVRSVLDYFRIPAADLLVAYDELDLPPGIVRLKQGGGHGGHNGMRDIFRHVPDHEFLRFRIGIGHPGSKDRVTGYVLGRPGADDERSIRDAIDRAVDVLPEIVAGRIAPAMKALHTAAD